MKIKFKNIIFIYILNIAPVFAAEMPYLPQENQFHVDNLIEKIGKDNVCSRFDDFKISAIQRMTVQQMQQSLEKEFKNLHSHIQYINTMQQKYQQSDNIAYKVANQGFDEQLQADEKYIEKQKKSVQQIDKQYKKFFNKHDPEDIVFLVTSKYPLCKECKKNIDTNHSYISVVTSEYKMAFCHPQIEDEMFHGHIVNSQAINSIETDEAMQAINFKFLFEVYIHDLNRISNNMDIDGDYLTREIQQMDGQKNNRLY